MLDTCDCDAASGEHLHSRFEMFDPVRGGGMELWFVTDKQRHGEVLVRAACLRQLNSFPVMSSADPWCTTRGHLVITNELKSISWFCSTIS